MIGFHAKESSREKGGLALKALMVLSFFSFISLVVFSLKKEDATSSAASGEEAFLRWQSRFSQISPEWVAASVERNPNEFACLSSGDGSCAGKGGLFLLFENRGSVLALSQRNPKEGLTSDEKSCDTFPSALCPLRVEAQWQPVCNSSRCENTRSFNLSVRVLRHIEGKSPEVWKKEELVSPHIQLSRSAECVRGGGVWAEVECLTPDQASARRLASDPANPTYSVAAPLPPEGAPLAASPPETVEYECPFEITINEERFTLERHPGGKGVVGVPAMNGCPDVDVFTFQCQAKFPASFPNEGQWVQVEAKMAPTCTGQ